MTINKQEAIALLKLLDILPSYFCDLEVELPEAQLLVDDHLTLMYLRDEIQCKIKYEWNDDDHEDEEDDED
mgnify:CR=1 FL=1